MTKDIRITYRRRHAYRTRSNKVKAVKTPGGRLVAKYIAKRGSVPKCGDCKVELKGLKAIRPKDLQKVSQRQKTVTRAYGGSRCAQCVRNRIVRAFLIEEQKIVKRVVAQRQQKSKK
ncbi:60S ribosomal protein L34, putative [Hondaea fermentalgiana]|uniref:60S ribosomal protein L34, putative n=1 Tax=Hondaea fermentalgiana TaxID=2315210 RepID=A0A2R5GQY2_9STRA|nr:60S ribosomal protein L34, putative [Hondaea fermentalgiana]|eukprot:GBG32168.1 60S ribosomal protein L34, putative [Hondaea fermentalgiana]